MQMHAFEANLRSAEVRAMPALALLVILRKFKRREMLGLDRSWSYEMQLCASRTRHSELREAKTETR
jgi:hypothetical protein